MSEVHIRGYGQERNKYVHCTHTHTHYALANKPVPFPHLLAGEQINNTVLGWLGAHLALLLLELNSLEHVRKHTSTHTSWMKSSVKSHCC